MSEPATLTISSIDGNKNQEKEQHIDMRERRNMEYFISTDFKDTLDSLKDDIKVSIQHECLLIIHTSFRSISIVYEKEEDAENEFNSLKEYCVQKDYGLINGINYEENSFVNIDLVERVGVSDSLIVFFWGGTAFSISTNHPEELRKLFRWIELYFKQQNRKEDIM